MRSTLQFLIFLAYIGAMIWGGWYVFSGEMAKDRAAAKTEESQPAPADATAEPAAATEPDESAPPTEPEPATDVPADDADAGIEPSLSEEPLD